MAIKLKITNNTDWSTRDLRKLALRVAREEEMERHPYALHITFDYQRRGTYLRGYAYYHSGRSRILLPRGGGNAVVSVVDVAHTMAHEFAHNKGIGHRQMRGNAAYDRNHPKWREVVAWAEQVTVAWDPPTTKERPGVMAKLAHAEQMAQQWITKVKRAQTALRKWQAKTRYYHKQQLVMAQRSKKE